MRFATVRTLQLLKFGQIKISLPCKGPTSMLQTSFNFLVLTPDESALTHAQHVTSRDLFESHVIVIFVKFTAQALTEKLRKLLQSFVQFATSTLLNLSEI